LLPTTRNATRGSLQPDFARARRPPVRLRRFPPPLAGLDSHAADLLFLMREANQCVRRTMANLLEQAIDCDDGDHAAKLIRGALGIQSDEVANYVFPKKWPANREQRALIIGEWLRAEARFLVSPSIVPE
jgi:hypothetical protein